MSKINKISNESKDGEIFSFPDKPYSEHVPEFKTKKAKQKDRSWVKESGTTRPSTESFSEKSILPSHDRDIQDLSHGKYFGQDTNNSIWNSDSLKNIANEQSSKERIKEAKDAVKEVRKTHREAAYDKLTDNLKNVDTRKDNAVYPLDSQDGSSNRSNYRVSRNNLSIFDTDFNFSRVPEKTQGEEVTKKVAKNKDNSWKDVKGTRKASDSLSEFLDKTIKDNE